MPSLLDHGKELWAVNQLEIAALCKRQSFGSKAARRDDKTASRTLGRHHATVLGVPQLALVEKPFPYAAYTKELESDPLLSGDFPNRLN